MIILIVIAATALSIYFYFTPINENSGPMAEMFNKQHKAEITAGSVDPFKSVAQIPTGD